MALPAHCRIGDGPRPVIMLHGWFSDHTGYSPLYPWLDGERFSFALVDAPGYGGSRNLDLPHSVEGMGRAALAVADHLGWHEFNVVGHSMGGKAAQWLCTYAEDRIRRAVGITPVPASGVAFDADGRRLFESAAHDADARRTILDVTTGSRLGELWLERMCRGSFSACEESTFAAYFTDWADEDFAGALHGCDTPFLALIGAYDGAITEEVMAQTLGDWLNACTIETVDGAGHYPMVETPTWLAARLHTFLAG
ncbi:alpha/beta fold hydrolase [Arhodomonas sp. AD133]|uniref:alpha/beta fold hydrolase n=1 Tax=Arhodomonas sp. AD133 TaxID=3415009 RepID=UPI003EB8E6A7